MKTSQEICDFAYAISIIVQQQGQHDFPSYHMEDDIRTASLCGLTVFIKNGVVTSLKARDMEIRLNNTQPENNGNVVNMADYKSYNFIQGSRVELEHWHNRLTRFQTVFCYPPPLSETGTA